jgi:hypothetical protein
MWPYRQSRNRLTGYPVVILLTCYLETREPVMTLIPSVKNRPEDKQTAMAAMTSHLIFLKSLAAGKKMTEIIEIPTRKVMTLCHKQALRQKPVV